MWLMESKVWLFVLLLLSHLSNALKNITAELGQNVTLTCKVPKHVNNKTITAVEWSRDELDQEEYVLLYRDGHSDPDNQLPSYVNRVDLEDKEMKDGDVSLKLMNVTKNDTGTYECRVSQRETDRRRRSTLDSDPINIIYLDVGPSGNKDGGGEDGGNKDGGGEDGGNKDGGSEDGGNKDERGKDGGNKDGGNKDGGGEDGGNKDGGNKDGAGEDGGNKAGVIAGSVAACLLLLALMAGLVWIYKKMKKSEPPPPDEEAGVLQLNLLNRA